MLLTITTTHAPATDLGYLLHKNPAKCQAFELEFGQVHVFYPEATPERCMAAMLLDVDPVGMVRGKAGSRGEGLLDQYVNDRLTPGSLRHGDHRFEWTRAEFQSWAGAVATRFGYAVRYLPVGPEDPKLGPPTQMAVFARRSEGEVHVA
jgi:hypothetical protein